jgi:16S rRNA (cytidine1402-2'-O)-methyltransferase
VSTSGTLFVVPTPIGNLEDITLRALRVLRECDAVVAEDTRRTRTLLTAHGLHKPLLALPAFDERRRSPAIVERLERGETLALCSDAGTPGISDPGMLLVRLARDRGLGVVPLPGPSAVVTAFAGSGFGGGGFTFLGFLPRTPGKLTTVVRGALQAGLPIAFYESAVRIGRTLRLVAPVVGDREVMVARELTKLHETYHTGTAAALAEAFTARPPRGECTVLVGDTRARAAPGSGDG